MLVEARTVPQRDVKPLYLPIGWMCWLIHDDETDESVLIAYKEAA